MCDYVCIKFFERFTNDRRKLVSQTNIRGETYYRNWSFAIDERYYTRFIGIHYLQQDSIAQLIGLCPWLGYGIRSNRSVHQQLPVNRVTYKLTNACRKISGSDVSTELYTLVSEGRGRKVINNYVYVTIIHETDKWGLIINWLRYVCFSFLLIRYLTRFPFYRSFSESCVIPIIWSQNTFR